MAVLATIAVSAAAVGSIATWAWSYRQKLRREQYIRTFMFSRGVFEKFHAARRGLEIKDQQLVARALRQFFLAYLKSGCRRVAMPSQVADDLWHEFILFTRDYKIFCDLAFGKFLHHTPAVKMGAVKTDNEGLRRVWYYTCLEENINPRKATRLPLLFALDRKLGVADGFTYTLDCRRMRAPQEVQAGGTAGSQCATDFTDSSIDGSTDGLGCSSGDSGGGAGDGGSSGCGGGCGGD
jgi:hypothetical protein